MKSYALFFVSVFAFALLSTWCARLISNGDVVQPSVVSQETTTLTSQQRDALVFIVQEEKLARDVYLTLYNKRGSNKFYNILNAEENHWAQVATLLDAYGIDNPNIGKGIGEFQDTTLATLYQDLVKQWSTSLADAMNVGILIEQKDIQDIADMMKLYSDYPDILQVLESLLAGSQRHLAAFQR